MREFSRIKRLPAYVFNITNELKMAARRRGDDIIDLSMGNPDGPTPRHIVDKLIEAAQRQDTHGYSVAEGIPRLRRAIATWYQRRYGVELDMDSEAIVTIGSKEGLAHLMLACLERGDTVLVPNPSYPIHIYGAIIAGADIRSVRMTPGVDFFDELERAIRELTPKPKSYNMAGWRVGFMVGNKDLVHALGRIKSYHDYGTFAPIQVASIVALDGPQQCVEEIRKTYEKRRNVMVKALHDTGWMVEKP